MAQKDPNIEQFILSNGFEQVEEGHFKNTFAEIFIRESPFGFTIHLVVQTAKYEGDLIKHNPDIFWLIGIMYYYDLFSVTKMVLPEITNHPDTLTL